MRAWTTACAVVVLAALATEGTARAQFRRHRRERPAAHIVYPKGLYLGIAIAGFAAVHAENDADPVADGAGLSGWAGFRLHPKLGIELGWLSATDGDTVLSGVTGDVRIYLSDHVFTLGGLGVYGLDFAESVGTGLELGIGAEYGVFIARALYRGIDVGGETFISTLTVEAGVGVRF